MGLVEGTLSPPGIFQGREMATITASALKGRLAELLELSKKDADDILWALQEICTESVKAGNTITLPNIGKLSCRVQAARTARNPRTGDPVKVPAKVAVKFTIAKALKDSAPSLKSRQGKELLSEAEEKQEQREKAKRKRERDEKRDSSTRAKKSRSKTSVKRGKLKKSRAAARF